ncbi:MAG: cytosine deaminase [Sphaerobacteraceae bacterium]|nr:MAG: cytosine deaminase [Sphaerobacteraceae bacterium]
MKDMTIKNVNALYHGFVDIRIRDGLIDEIGQSLSDVTGDTEVIDGSGRLLFPGFVDAHAHMDKSLLGLGWNRNEVGPSLQEKIDNERRMRVERNIDFHQQTTRVAERYINYGTTHIRSFVDIDTDIGLSAFEGLAKTREDLRDDVMIQIVAFPQSGMLARPGTVELMESALQNGADLVGGLDPSTIDRDPAAHLNEIFRMAEKYDVDVDIHLHEPGELGAFSVELIAERTRALGWQGRVTISHAFCLGGIDEAHLQRLIDLLLENDIAIMSHGPSGTGTIPPVERLYKAGVRMCTGNDGIRDAWGPLNMPDMLLRAFILAYRNNFRRDDQIEMVLDIVTNASARMMKVDAYGLEVGKSADLVLIDGETHVEAVIERPPRWMVIKGGKIVVDNR